MQPNSSPPNKPEANSKFSPELKKAFLIASPFVIIIVVIIVFMLIHDDNPNREAAKGNSPLFEDIIAPCPYEQVSDTLAFLRMQIDSLYTVAASTPQKAQNYDCICKFLPQAKADGRLIIREADGDSRIGLMTHLKSPTANRLRIISVDFEPNSTQANNVKIVAEQTNTPLYSNELPNSSSSQPVDRASFRLPTSFVGNINGSRAQLNLSKLKQEGDEITFRFNLLSPANPQQEQQGSITISTQIVRLNRVGEGKFEQRGDRMILQLAMETISFESIN